MFLIAPDKRGFPHDIIFSIKKQVAGIHLSTITYFHGEIRPHFSFIFRFTGESTL